MPVSADNDMPEQRILHAGLRERVTGAAQAAALVRPGETGFLARPHDPADLARGICELLARGGGMRAACAAFARETYAPETVARRHLDLYRSLLELP